MVQRDTEAYQSVIVCNPIRCMEMNTQSLKWGFLTDYDRELKVENLPPKSMLMLVKNGMETL